MQKIAKNIMFFHVFDWLCSLFSLFSSISDGRSCFSFKKLILTSEWRAEHPLAGQNSQHMCVHACICIWKQITCFAMVVKFVEYFTNTEQASMLKSQSLIHTNLKLLFKIMFLVFTRKIGYWILRYCSDSFHLVTGKNHLCLFLNKT